jgi:hypothetical protein
VALGLSCSRARACTAVGYREGATTGIRGLALRWDGRRWSVQRTPEPAGARFAVLRDVSCPSARACVAVGDFELVPGFFRPYVLRWDGRAWSVEATPAVPGATLATLSAVSCPSARSCMAVGEQIVGPGARTLALRRDGGAWAVVRTAEHPATTFSLLADVECRRPDACVAVGQAVVDSVPGPLAQRWDGRAWAIEPTERPPALRQATLSSVSCPRLGACVALGFYEASPNTFATLAEHQAGGSWTLRPAPSPGGATLGSVSCPAQRRCTAVGGGTAPLAAVWDGVSWTQQPAPTPPGATRAGLSDVECVRRRACVAVGTASFGPEADRVLAMSRGV